MTPETLANFFTLGGFIQIIKYLVLGAEFVYLLFAFIITREVSLMNRSFKTSAAPLFTVAALLQLLATILVIVISLSVL